MSSSSQMRRRSQPGLHGVGLRIAAAIAQNGNLTGIGGDRRISAMGPRAYAAALIQDD